MVGWSINNQLRGKEGLTHLKSMLSRICRVMLGDHRAIVQQNEGAQVDCKPASWLVGINQLLERFEDVSP